MIQNFVRGDLIIMKDGSSPPVSPKRDYRGRILEVLRTRTRPSSVFLHLGWSYGSLSSQKFRYAVLSDCKVGDIFQKTPKVDSNRGHLRDPPEPRWVVKVRGEGFIEYAIFVGDSEPENDNPIPWNKVIDLEQRIYHYDASVRITGREPDT